MSCTSSQVHVVGKVRSSRIHVAPGIVKRAAGQLTRRCLRARTTGSRAANAALGGGRAASGRSWQGACCRLWVSGRSEEHQAWLPMLRSAPVECQRHCDEGCSAVPSRRLEGRCSGLFRTPWSSLPRWCSHQHPFAPQSRHLPRLEVAGPMAVWLLAKQSCALVPGAGQEVAEAAAAAPHRRRRVPGSRVGRRRARTPSGCCARACGCGSTP